MASSPDTVQTLCMVAAMAKTPTTITGISHLKFKESDRINGTAERLRALGGVAQSGDDRITIRPAPLHGGTIDPANDHRTAMSFAVLGLGIGGITITDADCVNKSFPGFWESLAGDHTMKRIVLTGFRGTGKTEIGTILAPQAACIVPGHGFAHRTADRPLHPRTSSTRTARSGSATIEREVIAGLPAATAVISTGGGAVVDPVNMEHLQGQHVCVLLTADIATDRTAGSPVPPGRRSRPSRSEKRSPR